ncbi:MAG: L-asparaginase [Ramlibacter sp.]|jgi:L-asparaginase|nr:L-asparaginase [Ramlibacter sp.]
MQVRREEIVVLGTGGTIAGRAATAGDNLGYRAAEVGVDTLLQGVAVPANMRLHAEQVAQVDSKDMDFAIWATLAGRCAHWLARDEVAGVVVTHGTDTMEETAFFLHCVLRPSKPVVLTGAMRPATSAAPDGPQNLADAVAVAADPQARGVCVAFAGTVHGAVDVQKVHTYRLDAYSSGDAGPLAYVEEGRLRVLRPWAAPEVAQAAPILPLPVAWPRVEIVMNHAGAGRAVVDALVKDGVAGLVVAGTGNGSLNQVLEEGLLEAQQQGVAVRRASRCAQGRVLPLPSDRIPAAVGLSPVKARIALMLELMP